MSYELKKLDKSEVEFTFTVPPADYQKDLEAAAIRLSQRAAIKGFRPGKAPYDIVKQELGAVRILEEALEKIVQKNFFTAVQTEKLPTLGMPQIKVEKMAPGNELVFRATVALLPNVKLADLKSIKVVSKSKPVTDKDVDEAIGHLQKMQPKEVAKSGPSTTADKLVVNMQMFIDKVPVEGGQAPNHQVYLSEPHYIPGLAEKLVGLKKDEDKEFTLDFPKEHYQKHLAGRPVDFKVKVNEVFELQYPEINDEFAKTLGIESLQKMKELLTTNLSREAEQKETQRLEAEILEKLIEKSEFDPLPGVLLDSEKKKMFYELKHDLERRGLNIEQYLKDIKKTEEQIFTEFAVGAEKRAKAALISRAVAKEHHIVAEKDDIDKEIALIKQTYPGDQTVEENLKRPEVLDTVAATVQNRKVMEFLAKEIVEKK